MPREHIKEITNLFFVIVLQRSYIFCVQNQKYLLGKKRKEKMKKYKKIKYKRILVNLLCSGWYFESNRDFAA